MKMINVIWPLLLALSSCSAKFKESSVAERNLPAELTTSERQFLINILKDSQKKFENAVKGLNTKQMNFKVKEKNWSIAECIEHVTLAEILFSKIIEEEMIKPSTPHKRSEIKIKDENIRPKMLSRVWRAKSPEVFKPSGRFKNPEESVEVFRQQRLKTLEYVNTTKDDLRNHFWKHPLTGTIDLYQTIILLSAHLERHIVQIEKIKANKRYPEG